MNTTTLNQIIVFTIVLLLLISANVRAQTIDDAIRQDIQIQQRNKQETQDLTRQRDLQEINRIDQIIVSGNKELSLDQFTKNIEGKCLTKTDLQNIKKAIENFYIKKGYILARVYFDTKNISQGTIEIIVEEGKAVNLEIKDNSKINDAMPWRRSMQRFFAFGFTEDKTVNLRDIEQGLDQINRLSSNDAKMDMVPSVSQDGYSDIVINNQVKNTAKPSIGINNSGNDQQKIF